MAFALTGYIWTYQTLADFEILVIIGEWWLIPIRDQGTVSRSAATEARLFT